MTDNHNANDDDMIEMFFDADFEPQTYLNMLLSSTSVSRSEQESQHPQSPNTIQTLRSLQPITNALIKKFDFYTTNFTKEYEKNVFTLEDPINDILVSGSKKTKIEFYLDTLNNSISSLGNEVQKVEAKIAQNSGDLAKEKQKSFLGDLKNLKTIKTRLLDVLNCFTKVNEAINKEDQHQVSAQDFKNSLFLYQEQLTCTLRSLPPLYDDGSAEFLKEVRHLIELKQLFKGFDSFHPVYMEFSQVLKKEMNDYLVRSNAQE
ncbi:hypothetical protein ACO0QE_002958 [Hanseniaspora vineae]